jgi:hypothetical protein
MPAEISLVAPSFGVLKIHKFKDSVMVSAPTREVIVAVADRLGLPSSRIMESKNTGWTAVVLDEPFGTNGLSSLIGFLLVKDTFLEEGSAEEESLQKTTLEIKSKIGSYKMDKAKHLKEILASRDFKAKQRNLFKKP